MPETQWLFKSASHFRRSGENIRCFLHTDYSIDLHVHDFLELNIVFAGRGIHRIGEREVEAVPGSVFAIPAMVAHGYRNGGGLCVFHLLFRPGFLKTREDAKRVEGLDALLEIEPFLREKQTAPLFLTLTPAELLTIKTELMPLLDGGALDYAGADAVRDHTALKVLYWMAHLVSLQIRENGGKAASDRAIMTALSYIHEHYRQPIRIDDLCAVTFMSRSTFQRRFKAVCSCTPNRYLIRYRIKTALEMMQTEPNKTVVAHACGFYDLSHMEKCIRAETAQQ